MEGGTAEGDVLQDDSFDATGKESGGVMAPDAVHPVCAVLGGETGDGGRRQGAMGRWASRHCGSPAPETCGGLGSRALSDAERSESGADTVAGQPIIMLLFLASLRGARQRCHVSQRIILIATYLLKLVEL